MYRGALTRFFAMGFLVRMLHKPESFDRHAGFALKSHLSCNMRARDAGLSRESLYKALSGERTPHFDTLLKVMNALGIKLHASPASA